MGVNIGSIFGNAVLLTVLSRSGMSYETQYMILGLMSIIIGLVTPFMVIEPPDLKS